MSVRFPCINTPVSERLQSEPAAPGSSEVMEPQDRDAMDEEEHKNDGAVNTQVPWDKAAGYPTPPKWNILPAALKNAKFPVRRPAAVHAGKPLTFVRFSMPIRVQLYVFHTQFTKFHLIIQCRVS